VSGHGLKFGVSLLLSKHDSRSLIKQITPGYPVSSDIDSLRLLMSNSIGFVIRPNDIETHAIVLCDRADSVDHIHMTDSKEGDRVLPRGPTQELV